MADVDRAVDPRGGGDPEGPPLLSPAGLARREAMLLALRAEVGRVRRRRRTARLVAVLSVPLAVAAGLWIAGTSPAPGGGSREPAAGPPVIARAPEPPPRAPVPPRPPVPAAPEIRVEVVRDDPEVLDRCSVRPTAPMEVALIGDEELLALLAAAGRPAGLARIGGKLILTGETGPGSP